MKKSIESKSSSRRDFLKKSALGVASAGFVGADLLQEPGKGSQILDNPPEDNEVGMRTKERRFKPIIKDEKKKIRIIEAIQANDQDEVQWEAPEDSDIAIMFAPGRDPAGVGTAVVKAKQLSKVYTVTALTRKSEIYKYNIYCYATNEYVHAPNSEPEMIVP